jgi:hypothetical protein
LVITVCLISRIAENFKNSKIKINKKHIKIERRKLRKKGLINVGEQKAKNNVK